LAFLGLRVPAALPLAAALPPLALVGLARLALGDFFGDLLALARGAISVHFYTTQVGEWERGELGEFGI